MARPGVVTFKHRRRSEKCVVGNGPLAGRRVMLGWTNMECTIKDIRPDGGLVPYVLKRTGEKNHLGQSILHASEAGEIVEYRRPPRGGDYPVRTRRRRHAQAVADEDTAFFDAEILRDLRENADDFRLKSSAFVDYNGNPVVFRYGL